MAATTRTHLETGDTAHQGFLAAIPRLEEEARLQTAQTEAHLHRAVPLVVTRLRAAIHRAGG
eukprot:7538409-Prorocentrum_lima.AAC.1